MTTVEKKSQKDTGDFQTVSKKKANAEKKQKKQEQQQQRQQPEKSEQAAKSDEQRESKYEYFNRRIASQHYAHGISKSVDVQALVAKNSALVLENGQPIDQDCKLSRHYMSKRLFCCAHLHEYLFDCFAPVSKDEKGINTDMCKQHREQWLQAKEKRALAAANAAAAAESNASPAKSSQTTKKAPLPPGLSVVPIESSTEFPPLSNSWALEKNDEAPLAMNFATLISKQEIAAPAPEAQACGGTADAALDKKNETAAGTVQPVSTTAKNTSTTPTTPSVFESGAPVASSAATLDASVSLISRLYDENQKLRMQNACMAAELQHFRNNQQAAMISAMTAHPSTQPHRVSLNEQSQHRPIPSRLPFYHVQSPMQTYVQSNQ